MMLGNARATSIYAYPAPVDLRNGYNGLAGLVESKLGQDILSGALFLFVNQTRKSCKVLHWDGTGLCLFAKRLDQGRFAALWRDEAQSHALTLSTAELALFIEGCTVIGKQVLSPRALTYENRNHG
jgi:transposase